MTPKEKASELVHRIYTCTEENLTIEAAVDCALICVDELLKQCMRFDYALSVSQNQFLGEVKKELKNL